MAYLCLKKIIYFILKIFFILFNLIGTLHNLIRFSWHLTITLAHILKDINRIINIKTKPNLKRANPNF